MPRYIVCRNDAFNIFTTVTDGYCFESALVDVLIALAELSPGERAT